MLNKSNLYVAMQDIKIGTFQIKKATQQNEKERKNEKI